MEKLNNITFGTTAIERELLTEPTDWKAANVASRGNDKTMVQITSTNGAIIDITGYKGTILTVIQSFWKENRTEFTAYDIIQAQTGQLVKAAKPERINQIDTIIREMQATIVKIDYTNHVKQNGKLPLTDKNNEPITYELETPLLPVQIYTQATKRAKNSVYKLLTTPPLLKYSIDVNQVTYVPATAFIGSRQSEQMITVKQLIVRQVQAMRGINKIGTKNIRFDFILDKLMIDEQGLTRKKRFQLAELIEKALNDLATAKYIRNFERNNEIKNGSNTSVKSWTIEL